MSRKLTGRVYGLTKKTRFVQDFGVKGQIQNVQPFTGSEVRVSRIRQPATLNLFPLTKKSSPFRHIKKWIEDYCYLFTRVLYEDIIFLHTGRETGLGPCLFGKVCKVHCSAAGH